MMKKVLAVLAAIVILVAVFYALRPKKTVAPPTSQTFTFEVKNRKLVSGPDNPKVKQGDIVTFKITVDEDEELHLHGYDKALDVKKDKPTEETFAADQTGHFPFELEHSKTDLGALDVEPR